MTTHRRRGRRPRPLLALAAVAMMAAAGGCSTLSPRDGAGGSAGNPLIPTRHHARVGAFRVASNAPMAEDDPALAALAGLEDRLERVLGVRVPEGEPPIEILILDDEQAFTTFLMFHHPELPNRRAFFLAAGDAAAVYTARGEHLEEDLRHEATHALLHRAVGPVPLWLDEGLAEYFEIEPHALPGEAVERFRKLAASYRRGWRPDLKRLEGLDNVAVMSPTDYREAWAWSLLLLHGGARREALIAHLGRLRTDGEDAMPISELLRGDLAQLNRQFLARVAPENDPGTPSLTRLQSPPSTPSPVPARRVVAPSESRRAVAVVVEPPPRGLLGRMRAGIGNLFGRVSP